MKVYMYNRCGTCIKAKMFLAKNDIDFESIPIRETPPTKVELTRMAVKYGVKKLFNTTGKDYREGNYKKKTKDMTEKQMIKLLSENGNLIKRPFLVSSSILLIGFKEDVWSEVFG